MYRKKRHILVLLTLLSFLSVGARAQDAPVSLLPVDNQTTPATRPAPEPKSAATPVNVVVRAGQHEDYDRVVFDWPRTVGYRVTRAGDHITVTFQAAGTIRLEPASHLTRGRHFTAGKDGDGNLTVAFDIDSKSVVKDFTNGISIAVDITAPATVTAKDKPKPVAAATPSVKAPPPETPPPAPVPAVEAQPPEAVPEKPAADAAAAIPVISPPSLDNAKPDASPPSVAEAASAKTDAALAAAPPAAPKDSVKDKISASLSAEPMLVASLDPHTPLRAAVWARGGNGYIVFDRRLSLTAEALSAGSPVPKVPLQALDISNASGFSFPVPDNVEVQATREGTVWKIYLAKQQPEVPVSATLVAQPDFALGARFILPLPDAPEPIRFRDPIVGDDLVLVPLNQTQAFSLSRRMADFQIWPAAQGLVIKPMTDKIIIRSVSDGVEITSDSGLHVSSSADTGASQQSAQKTRAASSGKSLFDFAIWRGKESETFTHARQRLQQTIVDVPDRERNRARLELARFYFARGYGSESVSMMEYLVKEVPDLMVHGDFLALLGSAQILANHPDEGLKNLQDANLNDQPEIKLWQAVGDAEIRNWTEAEDKFAASEALLTGYPEPFYSRFFVLAIESALAVGNDREAADWLDHLETGPHNPNVDPAIEYLHGVLHAKSGRAQAAAQAWKVVAASSDRLYKVRAEMALIDLGVANLSMTPAQAADRLEALRFGWRGDDLEIDILHRLGQFYIKAKNVKSGLNVLASAAQLYPHSPLVPKIHQEMSETFRDVFLGELGKNLSPLEALTVYQQYRGTLMPEGADGVSVTRNLAERLAAIDLMGQAGDLLEDIAKNKLTGDEKAHVVSRLAAIRLLDHKPEAALEALDLSANDKLPENVQRERILLRAKALAELHREDEALTVLKDDTRFPAKVLRADINMKAQHWDEAARNLLDLVGPPPKAGQVLQDNQADWLVRAAICMAMSGDQVGLDRLAIDYGAGMAGSSQNTTFRILVEPEKPGQLRDLSTAQSRISDVDMFQTFLNSYRKDEDADASAAAKKP